MTRLFLLAVLLAPAAAEAAELVPVMGGQFMLGQVMQGGQTTSLQGNASLQVTPAVKFDDNWGLIPTDYGSYQGTKNVVELGGGPELFQDEMAHVLNVKGIYKLGELKLKPSVGYRWDFLRETTDESWGHGLFDYRKPSAGLEAEYGGRAEGVKVHAGFDLYRIEFPNYATLESQVGGALGREQAQPHTLNSTNYSWSWGGSFPLPFEGGFGELNFNVTDRFYGQQHIVDTTGDLTGETRVDDIKSVSGTLGYGRALGRKVGGVLSLQVGQSRTASNQNHYDAEVNAFNQNYYSYDEFSIQPKLTMVLGERKGEYSISYLLTQRTYLNRLAQDAAGNYLGGTIDMRQDSFIFSLSLPIKGGFKVLAQAAITNASSNMEYARLFNYHYKIGNSLVGVAYAY